MAYKKMSSFDNKEALDIQDGDNLVGVGNDNFKISFKELKSYFDFVSTGAIIPEKAPSFNLGSPADPKIYFGGAGTYLLSGVSTAVTAPLNLFFWNKVVWSVLEIPFEVGIKYINSGNELKGDALLYNTGNYWRSRINATSHPIVGGINRLTGALNVAANTYRSSDFIDLTTFERNCIHTNALPTSGTTIGMAFYDAAKNYIDGFAGTDGTGNTYQFIDQPEGAAFVRYSTPLAIISTAFFFRVNKIVIGDDQVLFFNGVSSKTITAKAKATEFAQLAATKNQGNELIAYKEGVYAVKLLDIKDKLINSGFINWKTGEITVSSSYQHTVFLKVGSFDHVRLTGIGQGSIAGIAYYNQSKQYISGSTGMASTFEQFYDYPIPDGVYYARVSMALNTVNRMALFINRVEVGENQLAFIEDGRAVIYQGGTGQVTTGEELIADLPVSDGSNVEPNYAYIDSASGHVIVKI